MLKTQINPANLQEHLESAANALQKGQAQYLTPVAWGAALARALPNYRPCVTDLTCGSGSLLQGVAGASTDHLLGCDIEDISPIGHGKLAFVNADVTKFFELLHRVRWQCDLAVLNPPWDLHQYRERVALLAHSDCYAVRQAFAAHDGRVGTDTIDSTVLTLLIALHFLSTYGEGFLIGNQSTLDRLILKPEAPHGALRDHIWGHVVIPGNICAAVAATPSSPVCADPDTDFRTGIIYFARDHHDGFNDADTQLIPATVTIEQVADLLGSPGFRIARRGARLRPGMADLDSPKLWAAAKEEWELTQNSKPKTKNSWNIFLDVDGTLRTNLSLFDTESGRVNKPEADRLFNLNGKHPMHLVMARESRRELDRAVLGTRYRVAPAVVAAVTQAIEEYNRQRAPLYPLNKIQRLGYVDENDTLLCVKDLGGGGGAPATFRAGTAYELKAETVRTTRAGTKMNLEGSLDDVQYDGSELAIWLITPDGEQKLFMDARLMDSSVKLSIQKEGEPSPINFTLHQLVEHFSIPEVPDVATINPAGYQANLALLREIEQLVA